MRTECKGILFDFDGTLVSLDVDWKSVRQRLSALFQRFRVDFTTSSTLGSIRRAYNSLTQDPERKKSADKFLYQAMELITQAEIAGLGKATLVLGAREILEWLAGVKIPVAILSNNDSCCIRMAFAKFGLPTPAVIIGRDTVGTPKPETEGALFTLDILGLRPSECWLVGDSSPDLELGKALGLKTILIHPVGAESSQYELEALVINNLLQLRSMLEE